MRFSLFTYLVAAILLSSAAVAMAQEQGQGQIVAQGQEQGQEHKQKHKQKQGQTKMPYLHLEEVCNVGDLLPADVEVKGSSQGMAISGRYAFLLHDKGQCVIIDLRRGEFVATYVMEGNTGHCNNASFGRERYNRESQFPLLYVTECRGRRVCYVNDVGLDGSRLVQTIFYDGDDISGPADWFVDRRKGHIWLYCTVEGERRLKMFALPRLADSDAAGEVHLQQDDVLREISAGDVSIPQGSMKRRHKIYLPDGVPSRDRKIHIVDSRSGQSIAVCDISHIPYEPEGVAHKGHRLYLSFHTPRDARQNRIYRFRLNRGDKD